MIGTATMPLITAVQNNIAIGSILVASKRRAAKRGGADDGVKADARGLPAVRGCRAA